MGAFDKMIEIVKNMSEKEAKAKLAEIFAYIEKINYGGYTKEQAWEDILELYRETIVYPQIFDKK